MGRHAVRAQTLYGRLDDAIAVRFPFVWRTRAWLWTAAGLAIALAAHILGRTLEIRRETLPTLETIGTWFAMAQFLLFAAFFMIVVDVRRRTRAVVVFAHRLRVIACALVVAVVFLLLPIRAFVMASGAYEPFFTFAPVAVLTAVLGLVGNRRRSSWQHVRVGLDRVSRRLWTFRWQAQLENFLGASFPSVFSAKLHAAPASFAILAGSLALVNTQMLAGLTLLASLYFVLRGQETIRHHDAIGPSDHFVLLLHGLCLFGIAAAGVSIFGDWSALSTAQATAVVWLGLSCCAAMQAARSTSALAAFGGLVVAYALMVTLILVYTSFGITRDDGLMSFGTLAILLTLLLGMLKRRAGGTAFARVLFTTAMVLTPSFGMTAALLVLEPDVELMTNFVLGIALFGLLAISIGLWMTTSLRRAIATAR